MYVTAGYSEEGTNSGFRSVIIPGKISALKLLFFPPTDQYICSFWCLFTTRGIPCISKGIFCMKMLRIVFLLVFFISRRELNFVDLSAMANEFYIYEKMLEMDIEQ